MATKSGTPTKADLEGILDEIAEKSDEALDPASTRVDLVEALREIYDLAAGDEDEEEEEEGLDSQEPNNGDDD